MTIYAHSQDLDGLVSGLHLQYLTRGPLIFLDYGQEDQIRDFPCLIADLNLADDHPALADSRNAIIDHHRDRDTGPLDSAGAFPDASPPDVRESTIPSSSGCVLAASDPATRVSACPKEYDSGAGSSPRSEDRDPRSADNGLPLRISVVHILGKAPFYSACLRPSCQGLGRCGLCWVGLATPFLNVKRKDLISIPHLVALALQADGWWLRSNIIWAKGGSFCKAWAGSPMPGSQRDRPTSAHEYLFLLTPSAHYWYDQEACQEPAIHVGRVVRYDGTQKTARHGKQTYPGASRRDRTVRDTRNLRDVWLITPTGMEWEMCSACKRVYSPPEYERLLRRWHCKCGRNDAWDVSPERTAWQVCLACGKEYEDGEKREISIRSICSCGRDNAWVSHFAAFPEGVVTPCIKLGCPEKVCAKCGMPWVRRIERSGGSIGKGDWIDKSAWREKGMSSPAKAKSNTRDHTYVRRDLGLSPACACNADTRPGVVLDPFLGSGTVGVVATRLGRDWVGIELNPDYVKLAEERIRREEGQVRLL